MGDIAHENPINNSNKVFQEKEKPDYKFDIDFYEEEEKKESNEEYAGDDDSSE